MTDKNMPVAEANELSSYEFAFHILPTVAEGEVGAVFDKLKAHITSSGGTILDEEAPARFDLAYEIEKFLEGRNRKFSSAYFGWVRFKIVSTDLAKIEESVKGAKELLRHLLIKLTKVEEVHPFRFHDALATRKIETIDTDVAPEETPVDKEAAETGDKEKVADETAGGAVEEEKV
ncbi:MAG: 30S ribosomal protein S6 [Patescibacteria group bacterium]